MLDLYNNKYDMYVLKEYIYAVSLMDIIKTQIIDVNFAVRYILNKKYQLNENDNVTAQMILQFQPHISYDKLQKALLEYDSDNDSVVDFETVSNIHLKKVESNIYLKNENKE
jgi:hypothetical protein